MKCLPQVYRAVPNDPPIEDDWGFFELVTPAELVAEIKRLQEALDADQTETGGKK